MKALAIVAALAFGMGLGVPSFAQDKPADTMQLVRDKLKAAKKLLIADNMQLSDSEAKAFWPVYESYQRDLAEVNDRIGKVIDDYAASYETMTDEAAAKLVAEVVAVEADRTKLMQSYLPRFQQMLPARKVVRYYQLENKIRAVLNYELASNIPLVK
jgi:hypothetical protein